MVIDAFGVASFTPSNAAWFGSDSFSYLASDGKGGTTSGIVSITVSAPLTVTASGTNTVPLGRASTFSATAAGGAGSGYTYSWDFGDGTSGTGDSASHTYAAKGSFTATVTATDGVETATATISVYVTDPLPKVTIAAGVAASEVGNDANGVSNGTFVLTRAGGDASKTLKVTVRFETGGGIADRNADFTAPLQVTFAANQLTATLVVTPKKDNLVEGVESIRATVVAGATYDAGAVDTATLALADDPPVVWIASGPLTVVEGLRGSVHVNRSGGDLSRSLPVTFVRAADSTNDPLAVWGKDYTLASSGGSFGAQTGRVTFAAGANSADITLSTKQRELTGPNDVRKGFELAVAPGGAGYVAGKAGGPAATDVRIDSRPYPVKQFAATNEGKSVVIPLASVASPGADLSYTLFRGTDAGTVSIAGSMLTFTPAAGFSGDATFYVLPHSVVHATNGSVGLDGNLAVIRVYVEPAPIDASGDLDLLPPPNRPPEVSLGGVVCTVNVGDRIPFSAAVTDPDGPSDVTSVEWDFDYDGVSFDTDPSLTGSAPNCAYPEVGYYLAAVRVTDAAGETATDFTTVIVLPADGPPPTTLPCPRSRNRIRSRTRSRPRRRFPRRRRCRPSGRAPRRSASAGRSRSG